MPLIRFTQNIQRHVACPPQEAGGRTVREALQSYFVQHQAARGYVLDEQGLLRHHMAVFVNGRPVADRAGLSDEIPADATLDIMQALSGG